MLHCRVATRCTLCTDCCVHRLCSLPSAAFASFTAARFAALSAEPTRRARAESCSTQHHVVTRHTTLQRSTTRCNAARHAAHHVATQHVAAQHVAAYSRHVAAQQSVRSLIVPRRLPRRPALAVGCCNGVRHVATTAPWCNAAPRVASQYPSCNAALTLQRSVDVTTQFATSRRSTMC
jgi:hypothetical protein